MSERPNTSDQPPPSGRTNAPEVLGGPVVLVEYRPEWPSHYEREAARIRAALGERVVLVEHAGSTSVPGLRAKPKIDIVLAVAASGDEPDYLSDLEACGYALRIREPHWHEHRVFGDPDTVINLHAFSSACREIERMLRFRDHLRVHELDRSLYDRTKGELAGRSWATTQDYADAKSDVVEAILVRAGAPGRSDRCPGDA